MLYFASMKTSTKKVAAARVAAAATAQKSKFNVVKREYDYGFAFDLLTPEGKNLNLGKKGDSTAFNAFRDFLRLLDLKLSAFNGKISVCCRKSQTSWTPDLVAKVCREFEGKTGYKFEERKEDEKPVIAESLSFTPSQVEKLIEERITAYLAKIAGK